MWAGVSKEFFTPAQFPANSMQQFDEYYTSTAGLTSFTHASEHAVIDLTTDKDSYNGDSDQDAVVSCRYVVTKPAEQVTLLLQFKGGGNTVVVHDETRVHDANGPFEIQGTIAVQDLCDDIDRLVFELRSEGQTLMSTEIPVSFYNAGSCATLLRPDMQGRKLTRSDAAAHGFRKLYTINGACIGEAEQQHSILSSKSGIFLLVDKKGKCARKVRLRR
jgi:hypothetical protein